MKKINILHIILMILIASASVLTVNESIKISNCEGKYWFSNTKIYRGTYITNCEIIDLTEEEKQIKFNEGIRKQLQEKINEDKICFDKGKFYNESFDLKKDYGLTCEKIKYLNDHFVLGSEQKDGGYVRGSYSGFVSHGYVEGRLYDWVATENVATGLLVKEMSFHLNCNNETTRWVWDHDYWYEDGIKQIDTKKIIYYTEADFVMYYINNCV